MTARGHSDNRNEYIIDIPGTSVIPATRYEVRCSMADLVFLIARLERGVGYPHRVMVRQWDSISSSYSEVRL